MKQNKKIISGGVILVMILLLGLYYLNRADGGQTDANAVWLCDDGSAGIQTVAIYNNQDQEQLSFEYSETGWIGNDQSTYQATEFASYIAVLGYMKATDKITADDQQKQQYGLDNPAYTVSVKYCSGKEYSYDLGNLNAELGMYITTDDSGRVYLVDAKRGQVLQDMVHSLYEVALPSVYFDKVRGFQFFSSEKGLISVNRSEAPRANGDFYWNIFKPFEITADTEAIDKLIKTMKEIGVLRRVKGTLQPQDCGLDEDEQQQQRLSFYDSYDSELTIYLGAKCGAYVYCRTNKLDGIYLISKDILPLVNLDVSEIVDSRLYNYEIPSVISCAIQWQDERYELAAQWVAATGEGAKRQRYSLNKAAISGADYNNIVKWFQETKVEQVGADDAKRGSVLGQITVERMSPPYQQTMTFRALAGESLVQVDWGGLTTAYLERDEIENLLIMLRQ